MALQRRCMAREERGMTFVCVFVSAGVLTVNAVKYFESAANVVELQCIDHLHPANTYSVTRVFTLTEFAVMISAVRRVIYIF